MVAELVDMATYTSIMSLIMDFLGQQMGLDLLEGLKNIFYFFYSYFIVRFHPRKKNSSKYRLLHDSVTYNLAFDDDV